MTQTVCRVDAVLADQVKVYSQITGVPVSTAIDEAIAIWLECWAGPRVEGMLEAVRKRGKDAKLSPGEKVLMKRVGKDGVIRLVGA